MKKRVGRVLYSVALSIFLVITVYSLYNYLEEKSKSIILNNKIASEISILEEEKTLDYYKQYYSNEDIIGSLNILNTDINTLLVKGSNNEYYLDHSIKKEYDIIGGIFVDYRVDLNSKQINIYGHNSNVYDVLFKELEDYRNEDYYKTHKYIEIWDGMKTTTYEIFSVQIVTSNYEHMEVNPSNWKEHIKTLNNSIYDTGVKANEGDDILILQTCIYSPANSFLIINSRKVI